MTEPVKRRGRGWKILGIVVGTIVLCVIVLCLWVSAVAGRKVEQMEAKTKAMAAEWKARSSARPVLRGTAEPGNAWDDYNAALMQIRGTKDISKLGMLVTRDPKGDPEFGKAMAVTHAKALELMRQGAGRATSRFAYDWDSGQNMQMPSLLAAQSLANLAVLQARSLAESGKPRESVAALLDLLQFGRDVGDDGPLISEMIGAALLSLAFVEARDQINANQLDAASLRELEGGLAVLETSFPTHERSLINEALFAGTTLRNESTGSKSGFSQLFFANAYEQTVDWLQRGSKAAALPWAESQKQWAAIEEDAKKSWNPLCRMMVPGLGGSNSVERERRVYLRMIRIAARYKATGEVLDLDDPFGAKMKTRVTDGAITIWSAGRDGVDDGGVGGWDRNGKDLLLDVKK